MGEEISGRFDLFGLPLPRTRDKAGRPEHEWTQEKSNKVNLLFAAGYAPKDAAKALGITMPTLRKHYFAELEQWRVAKLKLEATRLERLNRAAEAGNIAADKELWKSVEKGALRQLADKVADRGKADRQPRKGKKAQAKEDAAMVKGKFAPPPPPTPLLN